MAAQDEARGRGAGNRAIELPFYKQTEDFTCGPASLLMAMAALDGTILLDRDAELEVWRESTLVESYSTCRYGLALAAWRRGFGVRLVANRDDLLWESAIRKYRPEVNMERLCFFFEDLRMRCRKAGIPEALGDVTPGTLEAALDAGEVPLALTNAMIFSEEDIPHWVVISGMDEDRVHVGNPLGDGPEVIPRDRFLDGLGYHGGQGMLAISKKNRGLR